MNAPAHAVARFPRPRRPTRDLSALGAAPATVGELVDAWALGLRARNLSPHTVRSYVGQVRRFADWLADHQHSGVWAEVERTHIETYLVESLTTHKAASVSASHGALLVFGRWAVAAGEAEHSPVEGVKAPIIPESPVPVLDDDALRRLFASCKGRSFQDLRDHTLLRVLADGGLRRAELAGLRVEHVDLERRELTIHQGKMRRDRHVVIGHQATAALARYLRIRERHPDAATGVLFLGRSGALTDNGVYKIVRGRGRAIGIADLRPHQIRHTWAHGWLAAGGQEHDLAELAGWTSTKMIARYGSMLRAERACDAARAMPSLTDRL